MKRKYHEVRKGRKIGVVLTTFDKIKHLIDGYSGAEHASFSTERATSATRT